MLKLYLIIILSAFNDCFDGSRVCELDDRFCEPKAKISFTMNRDEAIRAVGETDARVYQISTTLHIIPRTFRVKRLRKGQPKFEIDESSISIKGSK